MKRTRGLGWAMAVGGAAVMAVSGCQSAKQMVKRDTISDDMIARVPQSQLGPVNEVRSEVARLQLDENRAKVRHDDAARETKIGDQHDKAVREDMKGAQMAMEHAQKVGQAEDLKEARLKIRQTRSALEEADAELAFRQAREKSTDLEHQLSEARLDEAKARLELAEFHAARDAGVGDAQKMKEENFLARVTQSRNKISELQLQSDAQNQKLTQAEARWKQISGAQRGIGGAGKSGMSEEGTGGGSHAGKPTKASHGKTTKSKNHGSKSGTPDSSKTP